MTNADFDLGSTLPTLPAKRVQLRWLTEQDVPALFSIFGDQEVARYWGHSALPDRRAAVSLLEQIRTKFAQQSLFQWGVALLDTDVVIGTCTLAYLDAANRRAELGFALGQAYWGRGYMSEALPILLQFAFSQLRLHRVWADTDPRNQSSIRVLERLGFQREGFLREHYLVQGEPQHAIVYGLLASDWQRHDRSDRKMS